ncbi:MAG: DNA sulfur modification protein DndB [Candidatus Paceibacterota bacterium]
MKKDKNELIELLQEEIKKTKNEKQRMNKVVNGISEYGLTSGHVFSIFNNLDEIKDADIRVLALITEQLYIAGSSALNPNNFFTEKEIKQAKLYDSKFEEINEDHLEFPITIDNVIMIDDENYVTTMNINLINELYGSGLIEYNTDTQRESHYTKRRDKIIEKPKLYKESVKQISERLLEGTLSSTTITFNALAGSSDEGDEIHYNAKKMQLTINKGTELDILDGFHRLTGSRNALLTNPEIDHTFIVSIKNYNVSGAQKHLAEISKINSIDKTHIQALEQSRYSDVVVKQLQRDSDLKGRISKTGKIHKINNEIVSYSILSDIIDEEFNIKNKREALEIAGYLTDLFDYILGRFHDRFNNYYHDDLISSNVMFAGYIVLAKIAKEENYSLKDVGDAIENIDFNRSNSMWREKGVLNGDNVISSDAKKRVKELFRNIKIPLSIKS